MPTYREGLFPPMFRIGLYVNAYEIEFSGRQPWSASQILMTHSQTQKRCILRKDLTADTLGNVRTLRFLQMFFIAEGDSKCGALVSTRDQYASICETVTVW